MSEDERTTAIRRVQDLMIYVIGAAATVDLFAIYHVAWGMGGQRSLSEGVRLLIIGLLIGMTMVALRWILRILDDTGRQRRLRQRATIDAA